MEENPAPVDMVNIPLFAGVNCVAHNACRAWRHEHAQIPNSYNHYGSRDSGSHVNVEPWLRLLRSRPKGLQCLQLSQTSCVGTWLFRLSWFAQPTLVAERGVGHAGTFGALHLWRDLRHPKGTMPETASSAGGTANGPAGGIETMKDTYTSQSSTTGPRTTRNGDSESRCTARNSFCRTRRRKRWWIFLPLSKA